MAWLAKLASMFGYQGNYCSYLVNLLAIKAVKVLNYNHGMKGIINSGLYAFSGK